MRLIDADELLTAFPVDDEPMLTKASVRMTIKHMPTVEAEPVRQGRWERKEDPYGFFDTIPVCSACGCTTKYRETSAYCPHCGALMDGVKDED